MKKLLLAIALNCATIAPICADLTFAQYGMNVKLDADEFTVCDGKTYVRASTMKNIIDRTTEERNSLRSYEAYGITIEFKLFVYAECPNCHGLYLVDNGCTNPNCTKLN